MLVILKTSKEALSQTAYRNIKCMIVEHELPQGKFVSEAALRDVLDIGRTPVREALLRLSREGLVTIHPRRGVQVTPIQPKTVRDIFEMRILIEPVALRRAAQALDRGWLEGMRDQFAKYCGGRVFEISAASAMKIAQLDNLFHTEIIDAMGNQYASSMTRGFVDILSMVRSTVTTGDIDRFYESNDEHISIIDSVLKNDVDAACGALENHLRVSFERAMTRMKEESSLRLLQ